MEKELTKKKHIKIFKNGNICIGRKYANQESLYTVYENDKFEYHIFKVLRSSYIRDLEQKEISKATIDNSTPTASNSNGNGKYKPQKPFSFLTKSKY